MGCLYTFEKTRARRASFSVPGPDRMPRSFSWLLERSFKRGGCFHLLSPAPASIWSISSCHRRGRSRGGVSLPGPRMRARPDTWDDTHLPSLAEGWDVHPPWSWKRQRPMEFGSPKVIIRLKVYMHTRAFGASARARAENGPGCQDPVRGPFRLTASEASGGEGRRARRS